MVSPVAKANSDGVFPDIQKYIDQRVAEFVQIDDQRRSELNQLAGYVSERLRSGGPVRLTFVCTHNSRRSHLSQLWAAIAAEHFGLDDVQTYSGGTEITALNPRAVAALQRAGLQVETAQPEAENPRYQVRFGAQHEPLVCFSKRYTDPPNPTDEFCAVMTCSHADENCPLVRGCELRLAIRYEDPKSADDTPAEQAAYDERTRQIAREMLYAMSQAAMRFQTAGGD